ncbi:MAG TPA: N-acetylglucosamine-6-phosphate deacetylase [Verrucomicrobiales bacterium]|nr:N-acetylglucosamine-6-phosphate deacetylase [Verrucomicrobiales bacterium]HBE96541.1 N-acetylglucosamine-6-phosphate deacetylase [Verrucomicrobiales bacterium]
MLLKNAHLISPGLTEENGFVQVDNGQITRLGSMSDLTELNEGIDLKGNLLLPGFIDIHAHGADGCDVCDASPDSLQHIAEKKLAEGVTTWLPTTLTQPKEKLREIVRTIADWAPSAPLRVPGMHLEGPFINRDQAGAQNPEFVRPSDPVELRELHEIFPASILSLAPELPGGLNLVREAHSLGIIASAAHTEASYDEINKAMGFGLSHLTHYGNAMTGLHHREIGAVGAGLIEDGLQIELIADGVHLAPEMLQLIFEKIQTKRLMLITDSVAASWKNDGEMELGGLEVVIEDSIARLKSNGALAGSTLQYPAGLRHIHEFTRIPIHELVETTSWNQAHTLGLADRGKLEPGFLADLVVLNEHFEVQGTYLGGVKV